jgi:hypothetical protein
VSRIGAGSKSANSWRPHLGARLLTETESFSVEVVGQLKVGLVYHRLTADRYLQPTFSISTAWSFHPSFG